MAKIAANVGSSPLICLTCRQHVARTSNRQKYCDPCRRANLAAKERKRRAEKPEMISNLNRAYREKERERLKQVDRDRYARLRLQDSDKLRADGRIKTAAYRNRKRDEKLKSGWVPRGAMTPEQRLERSRSCARARYNRDPLRWRMAASIRRVLKGEKMGRSWQALVGYSAEQFRRHIERQFHGGIGWHNVGEWHIDHIVPLKDFDCGETDQFKAAWALSNLRPLWGVENCRKGGSRITLL